MLAQEINAAIYGTKPAEFCYMCMFMGGLNKLAASVMNLF